MECMDGRIIRYKEVYGLFNRPKLVDYLVKFEDIYDFNLDEIYIMVELPHFDYLKIPFVATTDMSIFAKCNNLVIKKVYFLEDGKVYIYCY